MLELLDLFLIYCAATSGMCVETRPVIEPPLTQFSDCELAGRAGDPKFQARHPDWHLRAFTCAVHQATQLPV